jgi:hypothetical protein
MLFERHLYNLGIQYSDGRSSSSSLVEIPKEHNTDIWLSRISSFVRIVGVYPGLPGELSITNSFIKQSTYCDLRTKIIVLEALLKIVSILLSRCVHYCSTIVYNIIHI